MTKSDLLPEQQAAITEIYERDRSILVAAKGLGKHVIGATAAQELLDEGHLRRVYVFAPLKVCQLTWGTEWMKWSHLGEPAMAIGDEKTRRAAVDSNARIVVINIENLPWFFKHYGHNISTETGLLVDELSKFKAPGSRGVKTLRRFAGRWGWACGMTATPVSEAPLDIYSQALVIDNGKALGRNLDRFRRTYFRAVDYHERDWQPLPDGVERLVHDLRHLVYVADDVGYSDSVAPVVDTVVKIPLDDDTLHNYEELRETFLLDDDIEAVNSAVLTGKLQQVANGAVYTQDGDTRWLHNAKVEWLRQFVRAHHGPVAVSYQWQFQQEQLRAAFSDAVFLADDPAGAMAAWNRGEVDILCLHPKSAGHGLNLQGSGSTLVMLNPLWSADEYDQLAGRFARRGQKADQVDRIILVAEGTIEEAVLDRARGKLDAQTSFIDILRRSAA